MKNTNIKENNNKLKKNNKKVKKNLKEGKKEKMKNFKRKFLKANRGITLVALVVTIIVLLILAGVTIATLFNDNGIISQTEKSKTQSKIAGAQEEVELAIEALRMDKISNNLGGTLSDYILSHKSDFKEAIGSNDVTIETGYITYKETKFTIDSNGIIIAKEQVQAGSEPVVQETLISKDGTVSYVGCYADIDGNGSVDGIIYVDLVAQSGETGIYGEDTDYADYGGYTIPTVTASNLNDYVISEENKVDSRFDSTPRNVVKLATGNTRTDAKSRFYVMGLEDITDGTNDTLNWYYGAGSGTMTDYKDANGGSPTSVYFGTGKTNTATMISKWNSKAYGKQNSRDIWGNISSQVSNGWFVPSREELSSFGKAFSIDKSNYESYKLSGWYWSSSQDDTQKASAMRLNDIGYMCSNCVYEDDSVRLSTTF